MCIFCDDDEMAETRHGVKRNPRGEDEAYERWRDAPEKSPVLKALFDTIPIVFRESKESKEEDNKDNES